MPLSIGGGINTLEDSKKLFNSGADKVVINSAIFNDFSILKEISKNYGKQAIIVSLDFKKINEEYIAFSNCGTIKQYINLKDIIKNIEQNGAGGINY